MKKSRGKGVLRLPSSQTTVRTGSYAAIHDHYDLSLLPFLPCQPSYEVPPRVLRFRFFFSAILCCHRKLGRSFVFHVRGFIVSKELLCRLLTSVPFTSFFRNTASCVVPLF